MDSDTKQIVALGYARLSPLECFVFTAVFLGGLYGMYEAFKVVTAPEERAAIALLALMLAGLPLLVYWRRKEQPVLVVDRDNRTVALYRSPSMNRQVVCIGLRQVLRLVVERVGRRRYAISLHTSEGPLALNQLRHAGDMATVVADVEQALHLKAILPDEAARLASNASSTGPDISTKTVYAEPEETYTDASGQKVYLRSQKLTIDSYVDDARKAFAQGKRGGRHRHLVKAADFYLEHYQDEAHAWTLLEEAANHAPSTEAPALMERARSLAPESEHPRLLIAQAMIEPGYCSQDRYEIKQLFDDAFELARSLGQEEHQAMSRIFLANHLSFLEHNADAEALIDEAMRVADKTVDLQLRESIQGYAIESYADVGAVAKAVELFNRQVPLMEQLAAADQLEGGLIEVAYTIHTLIELLPPNAETRNLAAQGIAVADQHGDVYDQFSSRQAAAAVESRAGRKREATDLLQEALAIATQHECQHEADEIREELQALN